MQPKDKKTGLSAKQKSAAAAEHSLTEKVLIAIILMVGLIFLIIFMFAPTATTSSTPIN